MAQKSQRRNAQMEKKKKKKRVTHQFTILMQNNGKNLFSDLGNLEMFAIFGGSS